MKLLFKNIKELLQVRNRNEVVPYVAGEDMKILPTIKNAYLLVDNGLIVDYGKMEDLAVMDADEVVNADKKIILPAWCDSHTHIVYAGNREGEFIGRIKGMTYTEIAERGGGILNSAKKLQQLPEEELYQQSKLRLEEVIKLGTGAIEIKSGYGLTTEAELKMLRVISRLKANYALPIKATFLAAHALPLDYKNNKAAYLKMMIEETLPIIAKEDLAEYIDVFCDTGYFSVEDMELIMKAGRKYGMKSKVHVNQFTAIGGIKSAVEHNALSVDHLEMLEPEDVEALKGSTTMPVVLPSCSYFLSIPYSPARTLINAGLPVALASDYNPGSTPSGNMNFVISTACIKMKMTPEEAINAATINGAYAMGLENKVGAITIGKQANLILTKPINSYGVLPYAFGTNNIESVYLKGQLF